MWQTFNGVVLWIQITSDNQDKGEILCFIFTAADVVDREQLKQGSFLNNIKGKFCADKGYVGKTHFENLFLDGIQLITTT